MTKRKEPAMGKKSQPRPEEREKLNQQFRNLENDYHAFKQSKLRNCRQNSIGCDTGSRTFSLVCSSPRSLVCSLQNGEQTQGIGSRSLEGRRLLGDFEREIEMKGEICSVCCCGSFDGNEGSGEIEEGIPFGSCLDDGKVEREVCLVERENVSINVGVKRDGLDMRRSRGKWMMLGEWFNVGAMVLTILGIISMCYVGGGYGDGEEAMLVPT